MTTHDPLIGRMIAERYEIVSLIKAGGMGAVYRAKQRSLGRDVAIKFLRPQVVDAPSSQRFMIEAQAASRMNHPHVVSVFDFGRTSEADGELLFLVMELVSGLDLAEMIEHSGALPLARVPRIVCQTLQALAEAHDHGIIHRDVKPANIVLTHTRAGGDHVKVIDFGIARVEAEQRITDARAVCGTPEYVAPESALGECPGPAADLYSVGVVLFELLTGEVPFSRATAAATLLAHVTAKPSDPRAVAPGRGIPAGLAQACLRALSKAPEDRFESAEAFESAIWEASRELCEGPESGRVSALPPSTPARAQTLAYAPARVIATRSISSKASTLPPPSFVERGEDLGWAREHLRSGDGPRWIELTGRPGVGRTHTLLAIEGAARETGADVVPVALDPPPYNELGYRGLRHLVACLSGFSAADLEADRAIGPIDARARQGVRSLFAAKTPPSVDPEGARRAAAAAFAWAARRASARAALGKVILLIDDLDHLDAASLQAVAQYLHTETVDNVTLVSTSEHPMHVGPARPRASRNLVGFTRTEALRLMATKQMEPRLSRQDDDIEPLFIEQLRLLAGSSNAAIFLTLRGLVEWRVAGLSAAQRKVLQAVSVVGRMKDSDLERSLLRRSNDAATLDPTPPVVPALARGGFLTLRDGEVRLAHRIYRSVAIAHAPGGAIAEIHAAAAAHIGKTKDWLELHAYHAIRGPADFEAFLTLEQAARVRTDRGDSAGAISALWQAVSTARMQIMRGDASAAISAMSVFGRKLATALVNDGRLDDAQGILDEILTVAEADDVCQALVLEQLAAIAQLRGRPQEAHRHRREAFDIAVRAQDHNLADRLRAFLDGEGSTPAGAPRAIGRRPVLVVEDDRAIREGLQSVLESDGREAFGAANGKEALHLLERIEPPGLILLDLMMPVMTGWELLEKLQCHRTFSSIPVVVVSAVSKREERGAVRVIQKPVQATALLELVQEFCG